MAVSVNLFNLTLFSFHSNISHFSHQVNRDVLKTRAKILFFALLVGLAALQLRHILVNIVAIKGVITFTTCYGFDILLE